jgi:hypothetical protein
VIVAGLSHRALRTGLDAHDTTSARPAETVVNDNHFLRTRVTGFDSARRSDRH